MATNMYIVSLADRNKKLPLRGDMGGINLDFTPPDNQFAVRVFTEDTKEYTLTSAHKFFVRGQVANTFSFGGRAGLSVEFSYSPVRGTWVMTDDNLDASTVWIDHVSDLTMDATIQAILNRLIPDGGAQGTFLMKSANTNYALAWGAAANTGGGGTIAITNEVPVSVVNGTITLDGSLGKSFRLVLNEANATLLAPINFTGDARVNLTIVQGPAGPFTLNWAKPYAVDDALVPGLAQIPGGINLAHLTVTYETDGSQTWLTEVYPSKASKGGFARISPIAKIGGLYYDYLANAAGTGAFNNLQTGLAVQILRSGKAAEATGTVSRTDGMSVLVAGVPVATQPAADQRPTLQLMKVDYSEGPPRGSNRPSYGKQVLGAEGGGDTIGIGVTVEFRDLKVTGGRNDDGDCRGIGQNGQAAVIIRNCEVTDNNNGILSDNLTKTDLTIIDSVFRANGVGGPNSNANQGYNSAGYVHNVYLGHNSQKATILRSSFLDCVSGHNLKLRNAESYLTQVYSYNAADARELDSPVGGILEVTDSTFHKPGNAVQNNLVAIGNTGDPGPGSQEGIDTGRVRRYKFTRCRFQNDVPSDRDTSFLSTKDRDVAVEFIDCEFVGAGTLAKTTTNPSSSDPFYAGMVMTKGIYHYPERPPIFTLTGGPVGPQAAPGRPATVAMSAIPA